MDKVRLGKTEMVVNKNGFGALPIQRISVGDAVYLLHKAFDHGIDFYDTARFYTDSEDKIGVAFHDRRDKVVIASKTAAVTVERFWEELDITLGNLRTDYLDIYQFHNPAFCPKPGDGTGLYEAMQEAQRQGKVRFIGISNHRLAVAREAISSGLYATLQFPFSYLASDVDESVVRDCQAADMGFICMKAMSGGLITDSALAYAFLSQYEGVLPIWGIQRESELDEFLSYQEHAPMMTDDMRDRIAADKVMLSGDFCRGCGYCMPCPAGIQICDCARMSLFLKRAPESVYVTADWAERMKKVEECMHCGQCKKRCPYGLDTPELLQRNLDDFRNVWDYEGHCKKIF